MKTSKAQLLKIAAFTLVCLVFTVLLGVKLSNARLFADTYELKAAFTDASGVLVGDAVKIAGVDVGRVTATEIKDGKAIVTFTLDREIRLSKDSLVGIRWRNVLGQRFVYVYPGTGPGEYEEGDLIPASRTRDVADIGEFLNRAGPVLKAIDPEEANQFLDAMNTALQDNEGTVRQLIDSGASLATDLRQRDREISSLIVNADKIMAAFAGQDESIASILDNLNGASDTLARRTKDINALVTNFADVQGQLDDLLSESRRNIDATIGNASAVLGVLTQNRKNLSETLATLPQGIAGYFQTSSWGEYFNVRIVEFRLHDQNSNLIYKQKESSDREGEGPGRGDDDDGDSGLPDLPEPPDLPGAPRENVGAMLRYVLTEDVR
jgi:phospholipid/cholesterol/gamma-HCH transport system substrate-binding protein